MDKDNQGSRLLSYIIPTYNSVAFLEETIESIYEQNLKIPFEIIISDDCSTDNTQELIKNLSNQHSEIRFFLNQKNRYAPANRNFAISQSKGDLVYMLDHDNILEKNSIQKLIDTIDTRNCEAASVQEEIFFKNDINNSRGSWFHDYPNNIFSIKEFITYPGSPAASNNYMFKREAFDKTGGYPERGARENMGFGLRLLATGAKMAIVPNTKYYHRIVQNSMWLTEQKNSPQKGHTNMALIFSEFLDLFDEKSKKLILSQKAKTEADNYIEKCSLNLSEKGWDLTCGKDKYRFNFFLKSWRNITFQIRKFLYAIKLIKHSLKKIPFIKKFHMLYSKKINNIFNVLRRKLNFTVINIYSKFYNHNTSKRKIIFNKYYLKYKNDYSKDITTLEKNSQKFLLPVWKNYSDKIIEYFLNNFSIDFLSNHVIKESMFISSKWQKIQLSYLEKRLNKNILKNILKEDKIGNPAINSIRYQTSSNTIHHLNHLLFFEEKTGISLNNCNNIVEWGGGYGNMAKIFLRINPNSTYTIIDLPIFIYIQAIYLSCIFGKDKINIITNKNQQIKKEHINLIPVNEEILNTINFEKPDVFISTWAISESNEFSQKLVEQLNFFNSQSLLIAHQSTSDSMPFAGKIESRTDNYKTIYHKTINYIGGENYYLFAKLK